jgi:DNA-binding MarR family transcriptional regulator
MNRNPEPHDVLVAFLLLQRALQRQADAFFAEYGLTDAQFNILNLLATHGGLMDQLELTEKLLVGKSSTSIVLNRMVKARLVERREHVKDRRQSSLRLTAKGHKLWAKVNAKYEKRVREVFGGLPQARSRAFLDDLESIYASLPGDPQVKGARTLGEMVKQLRSNP